MGEFSCNKTVIKEEQKSSDILQAFDPQLLFWKLISVIQEIILLVQSTVIYIYFFNVLYCYPTINLYSILFEYG